MGVGIKASGYAMLIDYAWCTGCHSCEVACRKELGFADDQYGIKINEMIWPIEAKSWEYTFLPTPTDQCDTCIHRRSEGKDPTCVHHCQAKCLTFGSADEIMRQMDPNKRQAVFTL